VSVESVVLVVLVVSVGFIEESVWLSYNREYSV